MSSYFLLELENLVPQLRKIKSKSNEPVGQPLILVGLDGTDMQFNVSIKTCPYFHFSGFPYLHDVSTKLR